MKKHILPVENIMQTGDWADAKCYRVACSCHDPRHDIDMWIEIEGDTECQDVQLGFYATMYTPIWQRGFNRVRAAWNILVHGQQEQQHHVILSKQTALNLSATIDHAVKQLERK